jgi:hypothetical protein
MSDIRIGAIRKAMLGILQSVVETVQQPAPLEDQVDSSIKMAEMCSWLAINRINKLGVP